MRLVVHLLLAGVLACSGSVTEAPGGTGDAGASAAGSGGADAGAAGSAPPDSGPGWTVPPGQTYSAVSCEDGEMLLFVEIWPDAASECNPSPGVTDLLVLGIRGWDGEPGTFAVGVETAKGTAHAGSSLDAEDAEGAITVEPFAGTPRWLSWDLSVGEGRTDLGTCGHFEAYPCPAP